MFFFPCSYFNFISLWSSRNEERNPTQNGGRKLEPSTLSTTFLKKDAITKREGKKIKSFPKRKEQQKKQKVRGKHCPKNLPDVLSLTLLFFCNFIYPHPGRWKGSVVYQGGFELQVSPPSPGRRHHVARQAGEERGSGGRHFLLWRAGVEVLQARWFGFLWFVFNFVCLFLFLWLY